MINCSLGIIFDWDGVIIDSHDQHELSWKKLADENNKELPNNFFKETFGMRNEFIIPNYFADWIGDEGEDKIKNLADRKEEIYRRIIIDSGINPLPGVNKLLESLKDKNIPCSIGSSTPTKNIETVIELIGLSNHFNAITAAEDVSKGKPDPEVFLKAAEKINIDPDNCIVIEDAHVGIDAGLAANMNVVAVATTHQLDQLNKAHLAVESLEQIDIEDLYNLIS